MKNIILLIAVMVLSACASMPTVKSVAGTYEGAEVGITVRLVFLENGVCVSSLRGIEVEQFLHCHLTAT